MNIAQTAGGKYYSQARTKETLVDQILKDLALIDEERSFQDVVVIYDNKFQIPLLIATLGLLLEVALSERRSRK